VRCTTYTERAEIRRYRECGRWLHRCSSWWFSPCGSTERVVRRI